jgi:PAS domain S-box-containing protein
MADELDRNHFDQALGTVGSSPAATEHSSIEPGLISARQRLQFLLAVSPAIIYTTRASGNDYQCTFVSENLRAIMGYAPEEMTTDPKCWPERLHPDDSPRVLAEVIPLIKQGGGAVTYRFLHRYGHYIWIQDTFKVICDEAGQPIELVGAWADVSETKKAEEAALRANFEIQENKRYLTRLLESSADAIISTDKAGNVVVFNESAENLLGYCADEVIGRRVSALYGSEDNFGDLLREIRKRGGAASAFETTLRARDNRDIPVTISASVLSDDAGQEIGTVAFATDLRERKRAEEELQRAHYQARTAQETLLTTMGQMAVSIAHELNQPLAAIVTNGNAGLRWLANATPDLDEVRAALKRVVSDGHRASQVIGTIRSMFKKDGQKKAPVDVNQLIQAVLGLMQDELQNQRVSLQSELETQPIHVLGDRVQLQQVILNLITNAIDAMSSTTERPRVLRVRSETNESDAVVITVEDAGTGIDPKSTNRIFDTFYTTKSHGMGIGLAISRSIIEAHGGRISASPGNPHGAVFQVVLPTCELRAA